MWVRVLARGLKRMPRMCRLDDWQCGTTDGRSWSSPPDSKTIEDEGGRREGGGREESVEEHGTWKRMEMVMRLMD
jgi:hypothetical protein